MNRTASRPSTGLRTLGLADFFGRIEATVAVAGFMVIPVKKGKKALTPGQIIDGIHGLPPDRIGEGITAVQSGENIVAFKPGQLARLVHRNGVLDLPVSLHPATLNMDRYNVAVEYGETNTRLGKLHKATG